MAAAKATVLRPSFDKKIGDSMDYKDYYKILGVDKKASTEDIKKAYKALVKIHHPDANGGDRSSEDRLRAIIVAYTHLKTTGFVKR